MDNKYDSLKLKNQLCYPIYLCSKEIIRRYTPFLNEINLTYTQYIVMMYFWEKGNSNVKEISNTLLIDSSTLTPLLKKLESKGYITREKSPRDERNLKITITEEGMSLRDKALTVPDQISKCLNLTEEEAISLYKLTYKLLDNIERNENDENS